VGKQLGGLLKGAAKKALPMVGSAIGGYFGGTSGARVGSQMASNAGRIFGLELEGLSHEDQEYEVAKRFVQLAGAAAKNAAIAAAARQLAPGLIRGTPPTAVAGAAGSPCPSCGRGAMSGRWIRRGNRIILFGA